MLRAHKAQIWPSMLLTWYLSAGIVTLTLLTQSVLQTQFGYSAGDALFANSVMIVVLTGGCVFWGWAADRIGPYRALMAGSALLAITSYLFFLSVPAGLADTTALYSLAGFCLGSVAVVPMVLVGLFPPAVRYSGFSFSYNVAYSVFGGFTPMLIALWLREDILAPAHYLALVSVIAFVLAPYLARRVSSGK